MSDQFEDFKQIINRTFENIKNDDLNRANTIYNVWKEVLGRINNKFNENEGKNLADHTHITDLKNGILFVEADHPGWIELLKIYKKFILTGLNRTLKDVKIENLAFSLKKKKKDPYEVKNDDIRRQKEEMMLKMEMEQKFLDEKYKKSSEIDEKKNEKREIPAELASVLDNLRQDMLTNGENKC